MMYPDRVADVMGGTAILGSRVLSVQDLEAAVLTGLPELLRLTLSRACSSAQHARTLLYRVVPEATYKRRTRLTAAESEHTERLARVIAAAEYVGTTATTPASGSSSRTLSWKIARPSRPLLPSLAHAARKRCSTASSTASPPETARHALFPHRRRPLPAL